MHNEFDIVKRNNQLYMFLGKFIITDSNNKLIDAYKYNSQDLYLYVLVSKTPTIQDNCIYFDDYFIPKFLKHKIKGEVVLRLKKINVNKFNLFFKDKKYYAYKNFVDNNLSNNELELIYSICEYNYIDVIKLIKNTKDITFNFSYDSTYNKYKNSIMYKGKVIKELLFLNDDFVINIIIPLVRMIYNECGKVNIDKNNMKLYSEDCYNISLSNFKSEIIIYLVSKLKLGNTYKKRKL